MTAPEALTIHDDGDQGRHHLRLSGELDLASSGLLDTRIAELCADGAQSIELDMSNLTFMDSTGLRSVIVGRELCEVSHCDLEIGPLSPQVERLFEISGLTELLRSAASAQSPEPPQSVD